MKIWTCVGGSENEKRCARTFTIALEAKIDPNGEEPNLQFPYLHMACRTGNVCVAKLLIEYKADACATADENDGWTCKLSLSGVRSEFMNE